MELNTTIMSRAIMPSMTNGSNTLFGGELLSWMDEISGITAARYAKSKVATVAIENVRFKKPIHVGEFIDVEGTIHFVGKTSLHVLVKVHVDQEDGNQEVVAEAVFIYVAIDKNGKPINVVEEI